MESEKLKIKNTFIPKRRQNAGGFTLVEVMVAVFIVLAISLAVSNLQKDLFIQNTFLQNSLFAELEARMALKKMIYEIRTMTPSNTGAYPIALADNHNLTFFADINNDGLRERVRYYLATSTLMKGVIIPSGSPLVYSVAAEKINAVTHNVSTTTDTFSYYDNKYYAGTSSPLALPVNILNIRLIKVTLKIDADPKRAPVPMTFQSEISIRNLKDNL